MIGPLVYTYHINNEKHTHHGSLPPPAYLCSTSLTMWLTDEDPTWWP